MMPRMAASTITLSAGTTSAEICAERGAILTRLTVGGREVLYMDRATLDDATKNVRGGVPVLFPFAGKLADDKLVPAGTTMKQHGFGRNLAWAADRIADDTLRMRLEASAATRTSYPYDFVVEHTIRLLPRGAELELAVENKGDRPLPLCPGWHPYFTCPAARKQDVIGDVAAFAATDHGDAKEFDFGAVAPASGRARFTIPELGRLSLEFSPEMRHLQFWSLPGKPFICLEPFAGPAGTIKVDRSTDLAPGRARAYWLRIELLA
jgi:galactose mutarotase-like enzyme